MIRSLAVAFAVLALLATGCSSNSDSTSANYVAIETDASGAESSPATEVDASSADPDPANPVTANPVTESAPANPSKAAPSADSAGNPAQVDEAETITAIYDSFLSLRAKAVTGKVPIENLERIATSHAIAQVTSLHGQNERRKSENSYAAMTSLAEWSNLSVINQVGNRFEFTDCTERQFVTPGGATVVQFVTNRVSMIERDGRLMVDEVAVLQDGIIAETPETLGCAPASFAARAEATARIAVTQAERLIADPRSALSTGLPAVFADDARADLEAGLQSLLREGLSRQPDEIVNFDVLGMDIHRPDFTLVVMVCRTYPNGRPFDSEDGVATASDLAPGSSTAEWLYVQLSPDGDNVRNVVTALEPRGTGCGEA